MVSIHIYPYLAKNRELIVVVFILCCYINLIIVQVNCFIIYMLRVVIIVLLSQYFTLV